MQSKLSGMSETFKSALEVRRENMLKQKKRKDEFSHAPTLSNHVPRGQLKFVTFPYNRITTHPVHFKLCDFVVRRIR